MCGIVGIISSTGVNADKVKYFKQALFADQLRGEHSTGMYVVDKRGNVDWAKRGFNAKDFLDLKAVNSLVNKVDISPFSIGHNRHATMGRINNANAHPFEFGDTIGVHNGTLRQWQPLLNKGNQYDVDSEALYAAINKEGFQDILPEVNGAFALVWYDKNTECLHITRNSERPLALGKVKDKDTFLIASEARMMAWLAERNNMEIESVLTPQPGVVWVAHKDDPTNFETVALKQKKQIVAPPKHRVQNKGKDAYQTTNDIDERKDKRLKEKGYRFRQPVSFTPTDWTPYNDKAPSNLGYATGIYLKEPFCNVIIPNMTKHQYDEMSKHDLEMEVQITDVTVHKHYVNEGDEYGLVADFHSLNIAPPVQKSKAMYPGPVGLELTVIEFNDAVRKGCSNCGTSLHPVDANKVFWRDDHIDNPLCPECSKLLKQKEDVVK